MKIKLPGRSNNISIASNSAVDQSFSAVKDGKSKILNSSMLGVDSFLKDKSKVQNRKKSVLDTFLEGTPPSSYSAVSSSGGSARKLAELREKIK